MSSLSIHPNEAGDYDVVIVDDDGTVHRVIGLATMEAAWQWVAQQRQEAEGMDDGRRADLSC